MAIPNKKRENCLDVLAKQFGGSINLISGNILSKNIVRIFKDIAYGNITKDDFEKYGSFFTNRQNLSEFRKFALNKANICAMYVEAFKAAMLCGSSGLYSRNMANSGSGLMQQPIVQPTPVQQQPQCQPSSMLFGSLIGQQQNCAPAPNYQPQQAYYQQPQIPVALMAIGNPFDLSTNGLFAQIYDVECRKFAMWTYISQALDQFDLSFDVFVQDYIGRYLGLQASLNNRFRRDFALLD